MLTRVSRLIFLFLPLFTAKVSAQSGDLTADKAFFEDQTRTYQRWLDHAGLGKVLHVQEISVEEQSLSLYLGFPYQDIDSIVVAWNLLKEKFDQEQPISLEQQLFYKASALMEVRQSRIDVQIYDTYDLRKEPLFFRGIYFEAGEVRVEESNPRAKIREISLEASDFPDRGADFSLQQSFPAKRVFELILQYAEKKYGEEVCPDRKAALSPLENSKKTLRFEVTNLCLEVLTDEGIVCPILRKLGFECNFAKRELLTFTITHTATPDGFQLNIVLDGKYGPALYENVRRGGYMSMEIDFDEELDRYADKFKEEIRQIIMNHGR